MYSLAIIDDEIELREGLAYHFPWETIGFRVEGVYASATDALVSLEGKSVDVVLTDIRMPFVSGLDLVRSLKERGGGGSETIFCLLSAYRDFEYAREGIELGVFHYLVKPTSFQDIREVFGRIKDILDRRPRPGAVEQPSSNRLVKEGVERMAREIGSCSLRSISLELGISSSYLSRLFREETGENFNAFLQRMKMEKAAELLLGGASTRNKEICGLLGYRDTQSFSRRFKSYYGLTPSEYRKAKER